MYLPEDIIKDILSHCGITGYEKPLSFFIYKKGTKRTGGFVSLYLR